MGEIRIIDTWSWELIGGYYRGETGHIKFDNINKGHSSGSEEKQSCKC